MANVNITGSLPGDQFEPSISVSTLNPNVLNAVATDTSTGFPRIGFYRSIDGGMTWSTSLLPMPVGFTGAEAPSIDYTFPSTFIICVHVFNGDQDGSIFVYRSVDDGATWSSPILVARGFQKIVHNDEPFMAADKSPSSPFRGHIYIVYTPLFDFEFGSGNASIFFQRSLDEGLSWQPPIRLSFPRGITNQASIIVGLAGDVYVGWILTGPTNPKFLIRQSLDGGATFTPDPNHLPSKVADVTLVPSPLPVANYGFRCLTIPSMGADISDSGSKGNVYAVWQDFRQGYSDIFFSSSPDGLLWSNEKSITNAPSGSQNFFPNIAVSAFTGGIKVIYYSNQLSGYFLDVFVAESNDGGATFSNRRLTDTSFDPNAGGGGSLVPLIGDYITADIMKSNSLAAVWMDTRTGKQSIFFGS